MTALSKAFLDLLCCPESGQPLQEENEQLLAESCSYPILQGIPWLLAHPRNSLLDWGSKLNFFQQTLLKEISDLQLEHNRFDGDASSLAGSKATKARIEALWQAKKNFVVELSALLEPLTRAKVASVEKYSALLDRAPSSQNLLSYEANIYRDWLWGEEENRLSADIVLATAPAELGKLCVLGAGACKLALDIHSACSPSLTVATDINPLFLFAAKKLMAGGSFSLTEFPLYPKATDYIAIQHQFKGMSSRPEDFYLCFADAMKTPFKRHGFDTVLTPWLIDIQPHAFEKFLKNLNHYVPVGGYWLNFGSLVFNQQRESLCYASDEIVDLARSAGFEIESMDQHEVPYLKSPYAAGYRVEQVWTWRAVKTRDVSAERHEQIAPAWLIDIEKPIPKHEQWQTQAQQSLFLASVLNEINGHRSLAEIARKLAQQNQEDEATFQSLLVSYFSQETNI